MATTGPKLTIPFLVGGQIVGQGTSPELVARLSYSDASVSTPTWTDVTADVRAFSTSRGRENELAEVDAGTCTLTLDNRARAYDPLITGIRPMSRVWLQEQFTGETQSIFVGYIEAVDQQWPSGADAVAVVSCADEFKVLALDALPVTSPPRDSYTDLVKFDEPASYWRFHDASNLGGDPGPSWVVPTGGGFGLGWPSPILGEPEPTDYYLDMLASWATVETGHEAFDTQNAAAMTCEFWFQFAANPGANTVFFAGRQNAANTLRNFGFELRTTGAVRFTATNTVPTQHDIDSAVLQPNTWYHIAGTIGGGAISIFVNGVLSATTAWTGTIATGADDLSATVPPLIQWAGVRFFLDELAFYPSRDLGATRLAAHYTAGTARGFSGGPTSTRAEEVLDAADSSAPRLVQSTSLWMQAEFMHGQDPLSMLRKARQVQARAALLFIARDGTITFLAYGHRSAGRWAVVQATFDDDGTDLPYLDMDIDYSESFLFNDWHVTPEGLPGASASDATSIARYFKRSQSLSAPWTSTSDAGVVADAELAKYKDPMTRVTALELSTADSAVTEAIFRCDIGDRIRVFRTPPGGGARIDQTLFLQKIEVTGQPDRPWQVTLRVSPL